MSGVDEARRALGQRLRELRRDSGLSGAELATACGWQPSKVSRFEHGRRTPSEGDIRDWCHATGTPLHIPDLIASVRNIEAAYLEWRRLCATGHAHRQQQSVSRESLTRWMRWFEPDLIPGLLQTRDYAAAVLQACIDIMGGPDDLEAAVSARMERQAVLHNGIHRFNFVIGEPALYRTVGDNRIMIEQLEQLTEVMTNQRVALGIIPMTAEFRCPATNFVIFDRETVQVETVAAELTLSTPAELAVYERTFSTLVEQAAIGDGARALIAAARDAHVRRMP
ncbi:helix-turn-helix domain-containing protein [Nocardia sp. NPDC004711]